MIQDGTKLKVADNTGAKLIQCFKILGSTRRRYARIGDVVLSSVKKAEPRRQIKKKEIVKAVIVRQRKPFGRRDGTYIKFDENAAVILGVKKEPRGGRIFGPIPRELKERGFNKIAALAPELV